tara:strand:- start:228 stop:380 length:153 start_codon:yes stop_codon:yes gene_type:complete
MKKIGRKIMLLVIVIISKLINDLNTMKSRDRIFEVIHPTSNNMEKRIKNI